ncbi:MAG: enoyl-CoA hydratase/isomerase family protein [Bdellovibrionales bacterium]|nr:enoyl-CoA hydratase/isomerase family protein [Bdellovibrionales bacterium]
METTSESSSPSSAGTAGSVKIELKGALAVIRLGSPEEKTSILTQQRIASLEQALDRIAAAPEVKGLVVIGPAITGFCGGADVAAIQTVTDPALGERLARQGQDVFAKLAALKCTTVAAISGACVGGGCELALCCDYRILLDSPETKIGLPEIKLGIVPGFGGTQRLPRLIGLPNALDIILGGKVVPAKKALRLGLADRLVGVSVERDKAATFAALESTAADVATGKLRIQRTPIALGHKLMTFTGLGRSLVQKRARAEVLKETKGHYPAPLRALDAAVQGLALGLGEGLKREARALGEMIVTPESKSLVHLYFLTESASKLGRPVAEHLEGISVGVVGGGVMGAGIASSCLAQGMPVIVVEPSAEARSKASTHIKNSLGKRRSLSDKDREECLERLRISDQLEELTGASVVVEAIVEDLETKRAVFERLGALTEPSAVLASNTSSLPITEIARAVSDPQRVVGMHFFNPVEKMPLVEVVRGGATSDMAALLTAALAGRLGKYPVIVEDVPGFLVNRILSPYIAEAAHLLAEGLPVERIDAAALDFGMPMGPVRLLDEVGLDVAAKVQQIMTESYGARMQAPDYLRRMVDAGRLGKKNGKGFYRHGDIPEQVADDVYTLLGLTVRDDQRPATEVLQERLVLPLVNEAVRCLDERVAGSPGKEAAGQIDLATVMGMGFAPFRGGILHYAESLGARTVAARLDSLAETYGPRFVPCDGIRARAAGNLSFYVAIE